MASYTEWTLQGFPNPLSAVAEGQYELAAQRRLVYRVFDDNYIVELNTASPSARLWEIHQATWDVGIPPDGFDTVGIDIAPDGHVWLAPRRGVGLQELNPANGNLTHHQWNNAAMVVGVDYPCRVRFDASGDVWFGFNGGEPNVLGLRPIVGRLSRSTSSFDFWQIPIRMGGAVDVWPEAKTGIAWCSFTFGMAPKDPPVLGRLDTAKNEVDWWRLSRASSTPRCVASLAGDSLQAAGTLGIAYKDSTGPGLVLRYEIAADRFFGFSEKGMDPLDLDFDAGGNIWAADLDGRIYRNRPKAGCGEVRLSRCTAEARRMTLPLSSSTVVQAPQQLKVAVTKDSVPFREEKCYEVFQLPKRAGTTVGGITSGTPRGRSIFYSLPSSQGIGRLDP